MNDKNILSAVEKRSITNIRSALKGKITEDMNFSKGVFSESLNYVFQHGITKSELFDEHDGTVFDLNKNNWTREYFNSVMADLLFNFSEERINHIKQVGRHLYPPVVKSAPSPNTNVNTNVNVSQGIQTGLKKFIPLLLLIVAVLVVILLLVAIVQRNE